MGRDKRRRHSRDRPHSTRSGSYSSSYSTSGTSSYCKNSGRKHGGGRSRKGSKRSRHSPSRRSRTSSSHKDRKRKVKGRDRSHDRYHGRHKSSSSSRHRRPRDSRHGHCRKTRQSPRDTSESPTHRAQEPDEDKSAALARYLAYRKGRRSKLATSGVSTRTTCTDTSGTATAAAQVPSTDASQGGDKKKNSLVPMTKEVWEAQQSRVREVFDPDSGRTRLVRGDGEIIERIVSKEQHLAINKIATMWKG